MLRDGSEKTLQVAVGALPDQQVASEQGPGQGAHSIGVALAPLSPEMRDQLQVPEGTKGAVVAQVRPDSPAQQAGLREGDVIVGVGAKAVCFAGRRGLHHPHRSAGRQGCGAPGAA